MLEIQIAGNYSKCGTSEPIIPEIVVAIGLRWLAGGSYIDIRHAYGCSIASLYRCHDLFIDAVLNCEELKIIFPEEKEEFIKLASSSECKSSEGMIRGCVGDIDGRFHSHTQPPNFSLKWQKPWFIFFRSLHDLWNQCSGCL